ncbi:MAG: TetR/AcrR family transcriptional regulator [Nitrospirae bacterium]|nr:MAG: TetR/AcrR family transcriptional regulator [Nitrospirota bacterium]
MMYIILYRQQMRYPQEHKLETRRRILYEASRRFRGQGSEGFSISGLMQDLKLTHGGFYRHFNSKEHLFAEALASAMQDAHAKLTVGSDAKTPASQLRVLIETYLSPWHLANPAEGCPLAALASEMPRQPRAVRAAFDHALETYIDGIEKLLPGKTRSERQRNFLVLFSGMAGSLSLARAVSDDQTRARLLQAAKEFYIQAFCQG